MANNDNSALRSPLQAAWDAAVAIYEPIHDRWDDEFEEADRLPESPEREAAFQTFYKTNLPTYQRLRDELMLVPAPTIEALAKKMAFADASNDDHHDSCLADIKRLAAQER